MKPIVHLVDPKKLEDGIQAPQFTALLEKGWRVETSLILEDPRAPEGDQHRLALVVVPPSALRVGNLLWYRIAHLCLIVFVIIILVLQMLE